MTNKLMTLIFAVAALASCRGREAALTSSYGDRVVSGQIVMGTGVADSSPAGVQVSVVGTGMSATLGADGRFAFAGVPEGAELQISRPDGISARVPAASGVFEVSLTGVRAAGRSRGPKKTEPQNQYEGLVQEVAADSLTVLDSHKQTVEIALTDTTLIRKGDKTLTAADILVGDRVHVQATTVNDVLTAFLVIVQGPDDDGDDTETQPGGTIMTANGPVKAVDGTTLTVTSQPKGDVKVTTDDKTIIRKQGVIIKVDEIKVGDEVNTMGTRVDDHTLQARQIEVRGKSKH